ncbi:uncharacterized protein CIMG_13187 [Coccidioides immitis RS]|uniref:Uncharacterized protein n=1 Tax=Coccidioides immitis (strain RS) TaxID=246410 RepID=J3K5T9_COCIM|nr:uncharacterized protein CIMG_13187 [Coccidioides immitis RS]EAS29847.3 hypothetical protein CIMG_13187 [Coccidioides immitis RS]
MDCGNPSIQSLKEMNIDEGAGSSEAITSETPADNTGNREESDDFDDVKPSKAPYYYGKSLNECKLWLALIRQQFHLRKSLQKALDVVRIDWVSSHFYNKPQMHWQMLGIEREQLPMSWNKFKMWYKTQINHLG